MPVSWKCLGTAASTTALLQDRALVLSSSSSSHTTASCSSLRVFPPSGCTTLALPSNRISFWFSYHSDIFKWACENSVLKTTDQLRCLGGGLIKFDPAARSVRGSTSLPPTLGPLYIT